LRGKLAPSRSNPSEMPVSLLPRIMPTSGIAYCGEYQGRTPTRTNTASEPMAQELPQTEMMLESQIPG
jgi:hypothetical protein